MVLGDTCPRCGKPLVNTVYCVICGQYLASPPEGAVKPKKRRSKRRAH